MYYAVKVDIDAYRLTQYVSTGHPRTIGILLGEKKNPDRIFQKIEITSLTLDGKALGTQG